MNRMAGRTNGRAMNRIRPHAGLCHQPGTGSAPTPSAGAGEGVSCVQCEAPQPPAAANVTGPASAEARLPGNGPQQPWVSLLESAALGRTRIGTGGLAHHSLLSRHTWGRLSRLWMAFRRIRPRSWN